MHKLIQVLFVGLLAFVSLNSNAGNLVNKSASASATEITGLGAADSKFVIADSAVSKKISIEKLALNSGVGSQNKDIIFARSDYCSTGCSTGCSNGCSTGCSSGCSYGCSYGCR